MYCRVPEKLGTLALAKEFIKCVRKIEDICKYGRLIDLHSATLIDYPKQWLSRQGNGHLRNKAFSIQAELAKRYSGILSQAFRRVDGRQYGEGALLERIWFSLNQKVLTVGQHYKFSSTLWAAVVSELGRDVAEIKPKFMLRQFVDELPWERERHLLIQCAYEANEQEAGPDEEAILSLFPLACQQLHHTLSRYKNDLYSLSDGVFTWNENVADDTPHEQYRDWLLP